MPKREIDFDIFAEENREKIDKALAEDAKLNKLRKDRPRPCLCLTSTSWSIGQVQHGAGDGVLTVFGLLTDLQKLMNQSATVLSRGLRRSA